MGRTRRHRLAWMLGATQGVIASSFLVRFAGLGAVGLLIVAAVIFTITVLVNEALRKRAATPSAEQEE